MNNLLRTAYALIILSFLSCEDGAKKSEIKSEKEMCTISISDFGQSPDGPVQKYVLSNPNGMQVSIINYGGIVQSIVVPDRQGNLIDVASGFDAIEAYLSGHPYFGALIGRYGNRIAKGTFTIGEEQFNLAKNNGPNHLHGGVKGFDKVLWKANSSIVESGEAQLTLNYMSKDREEGYPGNLTVTVVYSLTVQNELKIDYKAITDRPTHVNLTNHSYFNLKGHGESDILDHEILINASKYTPVDETLIPVGVLMPVAGTPFDFSNYKKIGLGINADHEQIKFGGGYDHNFVLDQSDITVPAAYVRSNVTGIVLSVFTKEPGIQFYTGNFLDGTLVGKNGKTYLHRSAFCLETQHFPDSPNQSEFPSTLLRPGEEYHTSTIYKFSTESSQ